MKEFYAGKVNIDPEYWRELINENLLDAQALLAAKRYVACAFYSHMAVEKALKWCLATTGAIDPVNDGTHSLLELSEKAGVLERIDANGIAAIRKMDKLHERASYPRTLAEYDTMNTPGEAQLILKCAKQAILVIADMVREYEGGDKSE